MSWSRTFALRFALLYAALLGAAAIAPLYVWGERALVCAADLLASAGPARTLALDEREAPPVYRYSVAGRELEGPMHAHGFVVLLTAALVLATPGITERKRWLSGSAALLAAVLLALGMLASDLRALEAQAFPGTGGAFASALGLFGGLHRTAGAGLLPLVLWTFAAFALRDRAD